MFALGLSAEIERAMISERTKAGLERARLRGKKIGRAVGEKPTMKSFMTVNMFIKPKRRSFKREGEKELTSGKLRYKLKEWIFKKF